MPRHPPTPTLFPYTTLFRSGSDMTLFEVHEAASIIQEAADEEANIIFGTVIDPKMKDEVKVTVIATGFDAATRDRKSTRLNSSHVEISYAVFCLKKKKKNIK